jgi:hypothetical protein
LNGGHDFMAGDVPATACGSCLQNRDDLICGQVRVQLPGDAKEPGVDAFASARRGGEHVAQERG